MPVSVEGRPPYHPSLLLKIWLYGYFHRIHSTRKLEAACSEHLPLLWLTGLIAPDHNSLWRFWRDNQKALRAIFKQTVRLAVNTGAVGFALQALDGTKLPAGKNDIRSPLNVMCGTSRKIRKALANRRVVQAAIQGYRVSELVKVCANTSKHAQPDARLQITVRGAVQGVGFRPFVYRLATELGLSGWVNNSPQGVFLEVEGLRADAENFLIRLKTEKPPRSSIQSLEASWLAPARFEGFEIRESRADGSKTAIVLPDIATCPECLRELFDPANRRHLYPFTNCTHCGPRFSIIESLPYDRANTSMKSFAMCPECKAEYHDPEDRRFHAQPNACPKCGPRLEFWNAAGERLIDGHEALLAAAVAIRAGKIIAVKGIGGFHLMAAAQNEAAVGELRRRKHRQEKPFALMFPSLAMVKTVCVVSPLEERLLCSPEAPIVLLRKIDAGQTTIAPAIAPGNPQLVVMLPCTPLHHVLMA